MIDHDALLASRGSDLDAAAARWFARHRADVARPGDAADFARWSADPAARDAYARVCDSWDAIGALDPAMFATSERPARRVWPWAAGIAAIAAGLATIAVVPRRATAPTAAPERQARLNFTSRIGERMPVALADGSVVTLDTDSAITVAMEPRRRLVSLTRGRAFFRVAKAADRPFVVRANGRSVVAVGTSFSVDSAARGLAVVLVEGRVRVVRTERSASGNRVEMVAGDRLSITADGQLTLHRTDAARDTSWLSGKLVFDEAPLGEVAAALNRYSTRKIVFADPAIARRRISAVLGTGDTASFVSAIETMRLGRARPEREPDRLVIDHR